MSASGSSYVGTATEAGDRDSGGSGAGDVAGAAGSEFLNSDDVLDRGRRLTVARREVGANTLIFPGLGE